MKIIEVYEPSGILHKVRVDDKDYEYLKDYAWVWRDGYACIKQGRSFYQMHRMIMGVGFKEPVLIDHEDTNHENNTRKNLRKADRFQNQQNRRTNKNNTLPKGIRQLPSGKWNVRVQGWNKRYVFGAFDTKEEAVEARNKFAKELHKEFYNPSYLI